MKVVIGGEKYLEWSEGKTLKLPGCLTYSRGGMIPHLSDDKLQPLSSTSYWHIPLETIYEQPGIDVMKKFGKSFHEFSSNQDKILILNPNDSYLEKPLIYKYNEQKSISIWAPSGRRKVTPEDYMNFMEAYQFDICIAPSDTIPGNASKKRNRKSYERTIWFLDQCLEIKSKRKLNFPVFGVVEGGDSKFEREKCVKDILNRDVDGYVISGFDRISTGWKELLQLCLGKIGDAKPKIMFGILTPVEVIEAVMLGVDIFDSVIAFYSTERGCALNFQFETYIKRGAEECTSSEEEESKRTILKDTDENIAGRKDISRYEMDLNDKRYHNDVRSLVKDCSCYCCSKHNRAYLHHLLVTKEMLAKVLLMIHNLHHWMRFFEQIRHCMRENRLDDLKERIQNG